MATDVVSVLGAVKFAIGVVSPRFYHGLDVGAKSRYKMIRESDLVSLIRSDQVKSYVVRTRHEFKSWSKYLSLVRSQWPASSSKDPYAIRFFIDGRLPRGTERPSDVWKIAIYA